MLGIADSAFEDFLDTDDVDQLVELGDNLLQRVTFDTYFDDHLGNLGILGWSHNE